MTGVVAVGKVVVGLLMMVGVVVVYGCVVGLCIRAFRFAMRLCGY